MGGSNTVQHMYYVMAPTLYNKLWVALILYNKCTMLSLCYIFILYGFRLLAWTIQWLLHRYAGVLVHIGSVGLFSCRKVILDVKKGLKIVSTCFEKLYNGKMEVPICLRIGQCSRYENKNPLKFTF